MSDRYAAAQRTALAATTVTLLLAACVDSHPRAEAATQPPTTDAAADAARDSGRRTDLDAAVAPALDASTAPGLDAGKKLRQVDAAFATCRVASDCRSVRSALSTFEGCCTAEFSCGLDDVTSSPVVRASLNAAVGVPPGTRCIPLDKIFLTSPTSESERVALADGGQVLISTDCPTLFFSSLPFRGCCLQTNECAVSTYPIHAELGALLGFSAPPDGGTAPFTQPECLKPEQLNAQFHATELAGVGSLPATWGSCDYAGLDQTLPRESL